MALRATMSRTAAKPAAPQGIKAAVQRVAATAGVSVASLALALSASADVSARSGPRSPCLFAPPLAHTGSHSARPAPRLLLPQATVKLGADSGALLFEVRGSEPFRGTLEIATTPPRGQRRPGTIKTALPGAIGGR